jgi:protein TonB
MTPPPNTTRMTGSTYLQTRARRKPWGLGMVVLLHLLVFWAIQTGLTRDITRQMPQVVQAILLPEPPPPQPPASKVEPVPPAPPQPPTPQPSPPPPPVAPAPPPAVATPSPTPPAQVPRAEVAVTPSTAPTQAITAATSSSQQPTPAGATAPAAPARAAPPTRTPASVSAAQCDKPDYPSASRRMEEEGTVSLRFLVGVDGKVIQSEIEKSSGFKRLDEAARAGLSKCRFQPATVDGRPEQAWASMKYTWRLE